MARSNREVDSFIVRASVKDRAGNYRRVSISPALYSAIAEIASRQKIPLTADEVVKKCAAKLSPDDSTKSSFSRAVQDELVLCLVELLADMHTRDRVANRVKQSELEFSA
jgi:hypothetical protein